MVTSGMLAAGYKSLNIDDCWPLKARAANGDIVPDPQKFPQGMKAFSNGLGKIGVGLGIYTAHGNKTCQAYPGSLGHEAQDVQLYEEWNVVFVKNDWCWRGYDNVTAHLNAFNAMRDALNATGKPIVHSIHWNYKDVHGPGCTEGEDCPLPGTANMWRVGGDIGPQWDSVLRLVDTSQENAAAAGPGAWNDMDMLEVGNGMTDEQDRAHFTMWCILASPLVAGNDVTNMTAATAATLTNKHAIAVNQDPLGVQGTVLTETSVHGAVATQVWGKKLADPPGSLAIALLNRAKAPCNMSLAFNGSYTVLDLWDDANSLGNMTSITRNVPGTAAAFFKLVPSAPHRTAV